MQEQKDSRATTVALTSNLRAHSVPGHHQRGTAILLHHGSPNLENMVLKEDSQEPTSAAQKPGMKSGMISCKGQRLRKGSW